MIPNSVCVLNAKGGVGKTSLASNFAGLAAANGVRTLIVDLDPQANLARYLGYNRRLENDKGESLLGACVMSDQVPRPLQIRPGLRVITAGPEHTSDLKDLLHLRRSRDPKSLLVVQDAIGRLLETIDVDLVVFDVPPAVGSELSDAALAASNYVLLVSKSDAASLDGFETFGSQYQRIRNTVNPELEVLGAVLFAVESRRTRRLAQVREMLEDGFTGTGIKVFDTYIRSAQQAAEDLCTYGELAHEYGKNSVQRKRSGDGTRRAYSQTATKLATDYFDLYEEIMRELVRRAEQGTSAHETEAVTEGAHHG